MKQPGLELALVSDGCTVTGGLTLYATMLPFYHLNTVWQLKGKSGGSQAQASLSTIAEELHGTYGVSSKLRTHAECSLPAQRTGDSLPWVLSQCWSYDHICLVLVV